MIGPAIAIAFAVALSAEPRQDEGATAVDRHREAEWRWLFARADRDRDGWISFREANVVLGIDFDEFRTYDADEDGGVTLKEFFRRLQEITLLGGAPPGPLPPPPPTPLRPSPLPPALDSLDPETKGEIDFARVLSAFRPSFARQAGLALLHFDRNGDAILQASELTALGFEGASSGVPAPPQAEKSLPIRSIFASLDTDGDGRLTRQEIDAHPIARRALDHFSLLDGNGDGALDESEILALLRRATRSDDQSP